MGLSSHSVVFTQPILSDLLDVAWLRYYDYSDAASVTTATGISQIDDQSGNAAHATQATGANQPAYTSAAQNGLNVGTFDGTNDVVYTAANLTATRPTTLYVVAKYSGAAGTTTNDIVQVGSGTFYLRKNATTDFWAAQNGANLPSAVVADNNWHVFTARYNTTNSYLMVDGAIVASGTTGTAEPTSQILYMGAGSTGGTTRPFNGQIGFVGYRTPTTDTTRDAIIAHLKSKWAIA